MYQIITHTTNSECDRHKTKRNRNQWGELRTQPYPDIYLSILLPNSVIMTTSRCSRYCKHHRLNVQRAAYSMAYPRIYQPNWTFQPDEFRVNAPIQECSAPSTSQPRPLVAPTINLPIWEEGECAPMLLCFTSSTGTTTYSIPCQDRHPLTTVPSTADVNPKRRRNILGARMTSICIRGHIREDPSLI